jgi:hypothetical protein
MLTRFTISAVAIFLIFSACKKDNLGPHAEALKGTWKLVYVAGWMASYTPPPTALELVKFDGKMKKHYSHDTLLWEEPYVVTWERDDYTKEKLAVFNSTNAFYIKADTLTIHTINVQDGGIVVYSRYHN